MTDTADTTILAALGRYPTKIQPIADAAFSLRLKTWRRLNAIKQDRLADLLGVSQATISFWETGRDMPGPGNLRRLNAIMAETSRDEMRIDKLFIQRQAGIRALFDFDGVRLVGASQGFRELWPESGELEGRFLADVLVDEAQKLAFDNDISHAVRNGSLGLVSGVSLQHMDLPFDVPVRHRWHICFRRYGYYTLADVVYEPCDADTPTGITDLVYLGE